MATCSPSASSRSNHLVVLGVLSLSAVQLLNVLIATPHFFEHRRCNTPRISWQVKHKLTTASSPGPIFFGNRYVYIQVFGFRARYCTNPLYICYAPQRRAWPRASFQDAAGIHTLHWEGVARGFASHIGGIKNIPWQSTLKAKDTRLWT